MSASTSGLVVPDLLALRVAQGPDDTVMNVNDASTITYGDWDRRSNAVARGLVDRGVSRGAVVAYKLDDQNVNSETPTLLPGQTFEVNTVLDDPKQAGMQVSIQWPYGSNLHCEILADDQIVAQADQFIAPRLFHPRDDPLYGVLQCGAPLDTPIAGQTPATAPQPAAPPAEAPAPAAT